MSALRVQSVSGEVIFVTFPTDEAHAAFITTVFEELGIGRDFGSVLVVPVSGGESSYRHMVRPPPACAYASAPCLLPLPLPVFTRAGLEQP